VPRAILFNLRPPGVKNTGETARATVMRLFPILRGQIVSFGGGLPAFLRFEANLLLDPLCLRARRPLQTISVC